MTGTRPDDTGRAGREAGAERILEDGCDGVLQPGRTPGRNAEADRADGGDEILRTGRGGGKVRPAADRPAPIHGQGTHNEAGGGGRLTRSPDGLASGAADETYGGWLPTDVLLTPGEALAALLVAEMGLGLALVALALAERLAEIPEPVAGHGFAAAFLCGLVCGLYVLVRLRSRRLAWRRHLRGEP